VPLILEGFLLKQVQNKELSYRRRTARCAVLVEILSIVV